MIIYDWIRKWSEFFPNKIAIKEYETRRELTYLQLNNIANFIAKKFVEEFNLEIGDRIAILSENSIEHFVLFSVAQKTALILVPLNYRLAPRELEIQLKDCEPSVIIVEEKYYERIRSLEDYHKIEFKLSLEDFGDIIEKQKDELISFHSIDSFDENHPIFILYTSGTTEFRRAPYTLIKCWHGIVLTLL